MLVKLLKLIYFWEYANSVIKDKLLWNIQKPQVGLFAPGKWRLTFKIHLRSRNWAFEGTFTLFTHWWTVFFFWRYSDKLQKAYQDISTSCPAYIKLVIWSDLCWLVLSNSSSICGCACVFLLPWASDGPHYAPVSVHTSSVWALAPCPHLCQGDLSPPAFLPLTPAGLTWPRGAVNVLAASLLGRLDMGWHLHLFPLYTAEKHWAIIYLFICLFHLYLTRLATLHWR